MRKKSFIAFVILALYANTTTAITIDDIELKALKGDPQSQYRIALAYDYGKLVEKDLSQAEYWYKLAAENGITKASALLAKIYYENGESQKAKKALQPALKEKLPFAVFYYGKILKEEKNEKGLEYIKYAADKGVPDALFSWGEYNLNEKQNNYVAYVYFKLAAMTSKKYQKNIEYKQAEKTLSPKQLVSANSRVKRYYEKIKELKSQNK